MDKTVAVVGQKELVQPFQAVGVDVFVTEPGGDVQTQVEGLVNQGYQLIFFTDDLSEKLQPLIERFRTSAFPCLVALPFTSPFAGEKRLRDAVRRACGVDILGSAAGEESPNPQNSAIKEKK